MEIHKFGGASIKDAKSIQKISDIITYHIKEGVIVVSAMGKSTNLLELLTNAYYVSKSTVEDFDKFKAYNQSIIDGLFDAKELIHLEMDEIYEKLSDKLKAKASQNYDYEYDQIVSFGELISSRIIFSYLNMRGHSIKFINATHLIKTDSFYREGNVNWEVTQERVSEIKGIEEKLILTQGFVASDMNNLPVTLGREGSDYSAAILGNLLDASKVTVWKDVPGIMCADPNWIPDCNVLERLSYHELIELSYFGAKVIHPKTIKPLQNKKIPLVVRSFKDINGKGTIVNDSEPVNMPSVFVKKENQFLISIWQIDFSFISEQNLSQIFGVFAEFNVKVNIMQNSAISYSICVDGDASKIKQAINELKKFYHVKYNENLELISIRHTVPGVENEILEDRTVMLEQKSRTMARFVVRAL